MLCDYFNNLIKPHRFIILSIVLDHLITPDIFNRKKETPLYLVTRDLSSADNRKMAKFLIKKGDNILSPHPITGFTPAVQIIQCKDQDLIDHLLSKLPNINTPLDSVGGTALHHAVRCGDQTTVLNLLERGANPNQENVVGNTPVHEAVLSRGYNLLKTLVDHGGDINKMGVGGKRPLHMVSYSQYKNIVMDKVLECKPSLEAKDAEGNTALFYFVTQFEDGIEEILKLLDCGCDPNAKNNEGMNLLHVISIKSTETSTSVNSKSLVNILIQYGIDVDAQTHEDQNTTLHLAVKHRNDLVATLLFNNASLFKRNAQGFTPFDVAIIEFHICAVLAIIPFAILRNISEKELINVSGNGEVARGTMMGFITEDTFERCREEQELLRTIELRFYPAISYYDLLYMSDEKFVDLLRNFNFRRSFPKYLKLFKESKLYNFALKEKLKAAQRHRLAQDMVTEFLYITIELPRLCIERILHHMEKKELFRLQRQLENSSRVIHTETERN